MKCYQDEDAKYPSYSEMDGNRPYHIDINSLSDAERARVLRKAQINLNNVIVEYHEKLNTSSKMILSELKYEHLLAWGSNVGFHARTTYGYKLTRCFMNLLERIIDNVPHRFGGSHPWGDWFDRERLVAYWLKAKELEMSMTDFNN